MKNLEQGINLLRRKHLRREKKISLVRSGAQGRNAKEARGIEEKEARACSSVADEEKGRKEGKRKPTLVTSATLPFVRERRSPDD
jgi:hypothetical protein